MASDRVNLQSRPDFPTAVAPPEGLTTDWIICSKLIQTEDGNTGNAKDAKDRDFCDYRRSLIINWKGMLLCDDFGRVVLNHPKEPGVAQE
jgi:hypothetical protein